MGKRGIKASWSAYCQYQKRVWGRAKKETLSLDDWPSWVSAGIVCVLTFLITWVVRGVGEAGSFATSAVIALIAGLIATVFSFLLKLWLAPFHIIEEQDGALKAGSDKAATDMQSLIAIRKDVSGWVQRGLDSSVGVNAGGYLLTARELGVFPADECMDLLNVMKIAEEGGHEWQAHMTPHFAVFFAFTSWARITAGSTLHTRAFHSQALEKFVQMLDQRIEKLRRRVSATASA